MPQVFTFPLPLDFRKSVHNFVRNRVFPEKGTIGHSQTRIGLMCGASARVTGVVKRDHRPRPGRNAMLSHRSETEHHCRLDPGQFGVHLYTANSDGPGQATTQTRVTTTPQTSPIRVTVTPRGGYSHSHTNRSLLSGSQLHHKHRDSLLCLVFSLFVSETLLF